MPGASRWRAPASLPCAAAFWTSILPPPSSPSGRSSGGTNWTAWAYSTRPPSAGWRTSTARRSCPPPRLCPGLAPGGLLGLAGDIDHRREQVAAANRRRKLEHFAALTQTLENDARAISELGSFTAADRYLDLIYPDFACAADYLPPDAILLFCDSPRVSEGAKNYRWRQNDSRSPACWRPVCSGGKRRGTPPTTRRCASTSAGSSPLSIWTAFWWGSTPRRPGRR